MEQLRKDVILELYRLGNDLLKIEEVTKYPKSTINKAMNTEQLRRDVIIELHRAGNHKRTIQEVTKYSRLTIHRIIKRYEETGLTKRKEGKERKRRKDALDEDFKQFVKTLWQPSMSIRSLAMQANVSETTMLRAIREDGPRNKTTVQHKGHKKTEVQVKHEADQIDGNQQGLKKGRADEISCDTCKKVLKSWDSLKDHKRTHTGEKPFACPYCDYCGSSTSLLAHHKRQRHKEERVREEKEKEKKRDEMVQRYLHKSATDESVIDEGDKKKEEDITDKRGTTDEEGITNKEN